MPLLFGIKLVKFDVILASIDVKMNQIVVIIRNDFRTILNSFTVQNGFQLL